MNVVQSTTNQTETLPVTDMLSQVLYVYDKESELSCPGITGAALMI